MFSYDMEVGRTGVSPLAHYSRGGVGPSGPRPLSLGCIGLPHSFSFWCFAPLPSIPPPGAVVPSGQWLSGPGLLQATDGVSLTPPPLGPPGAVVPSDQWLPCPGVLQAADGRPLLAHEPRRQHRQRQALAHHRGLLQVCEQVWMWTQVWGNVGRHWQRQALVCHHRRLRCEMWGSSRNKVGSPLDWQCRPKLTPPP